MGKAWFVRSMGGKNLAINSTATKTAQNLTKQSLFALLQTWQLIKKTWLAVNPYKPNGKQAFQTRWRAYTQRSTTSRQRWTRPESMKTVVKASYSSLIVSSRVYGTWQLTRKNMVNRNTL